MKIVVTGGGSGGHVYPAIAIADKFMEKNSDNDILYIGYRDGFEKRIVPGAGYRLAEIDTRWVDRSNLKEIFLTAYHVMHGIFQAKKILKEYKPDVIIGTGGYVCFPVIYSGHKLGIPCYLHEQNAFPGLANLKLEKYVKKIFLGFADAGRHFADKGKLTVSGNPVRKTFFEADKYEARKKIGISHDDYVVLSFGGSLGAEALNKEVFGLMKAMNGKQGEVLIFGTGRWYYDDVMAMISEEKIVLSDNIKIVNYIDNMEEVLAATDVLISRAGALSVAETLVAGKPAILVPSPNVTGNHQYYNARAVADRGGAILIEEKDLSAEILITEVEKLKNNPELREEMGVKAREAAPLDALEIIYEGIAGDNQ